MIIFSARLNVTPSDIESGRNIESAWFQRFVESKNCDITYVNDK